MREEPIIAQLHGPTGKLELEVRLSSFRNEYRVPLSRPWSERLHDFGALPGASFNLRYAVYVNTGPAAGGEARPFDFDFHFDRVDGG